MLKTNLITLRRESPRPRRIVLGYRSIRNGAPTPTIWCRRRRGLSRRKMGSRRPFLSSLLVRLSDVANRAENFDETPLLDSRVQKGICIGTFIVGESLNMLETFFEFISKNSKRLSRKQRSLVLAILRSHIAESSRYRIGLVCFWCARGLPAIIFEFSCHLQPFCKCARLNALTDSPDVFQKRTGRFWICCATLLNFQTSMELGSERVLFARQCLKNFCHIDDVSTGVDGSDTT
ncbi:hypothetical protein MCERE3_00244 [Candidatus Nanopelagicaceae bacterium]